MKSVIGSLSLLLSLCAATAFAQDKPGVVATEAVETVLTVRGVNHVERTVTFAAPDGDVQTIKVPDESQNLYQVYAGAKFRVLYAQSLVVGVTDLQHPPSADEAQKMELAAKGDTPGGVFVNVKQITATVEGINHEERWVTVRGPQGGLRKLSVRPEVERFNNINVGDTVVLRYTEALALKMIKE
jgi:hypothetical protein